MRARSFPATPRSPKKPSTRKCTGRSGVILVNDVYRARAPRTSFPNSRSPRGRPTRAFCFVQVKADRRRRVVSRPKASDLEDACIDNPATTIGRIRAALDLKIAIDVDIRRDSKTVHNVAAYLPGSTDGIRRDRRALRSSGPGRRAFAGAVADRDRFIPGADDNASGTAGVIELARWFAKQPKQKRGILFLTFAGEELGLLGSELVRESSDAAASAKPSR